MNSINIKIVNKSTNPIPAYKRVGDSGLNIAAFIEEPIVLNSLERAIIPTGIYLDIPVGYEVQVRPRSGNSINYGYTVLNTPGTIDSNYTGEIGVIIVNLSNTSITINNGDLIAQLVCCKVEHVTMTETSNIEKITTRGSEGYDSSKNLSNLTSSQSKYIECPSCQEITARLVNSKTVYLDEVEIFDNYYCESCKEYFSLLKE